MGQAGNPGITVLPGLMAVRKRPVMYFGAEQDDPSLPSRVMAFAIQDALSETPVDSVLRVTAIIESDLIFAVEDDGPGLSANPHFEFDIPWATRVLTQLFSGRGDLPRGAGLALVTSVCAMVVADMWQDGYHYRQWADWERPPPQLQKLGATQRHGTRLRCHLDPVYFDPSAALQANEVQARTGEIPSRAAMTLIDRRNHS